MLCLRFPNDFVYQRRIAKKIERGRNPANFNVIFFICLFICLLEFRIKLPLEFTANLLVSLTVSDNFYSKFIQEIGKIKEVFREQNLIKDKKEKRE